VRASRSILLPLKAVAMNLKLSPARAAEGSAQASGR
jgi:hypothetical protein